MRDRKRIIEEILSRKKSAHALKLDIFGQTVCNVDNEEYIKKKLHIATPYRERIALVSTRFSTIRSLTASTDFSEQLSSVHVRKSFETQWIYQMLLLSLTV